MMEGVTLPAPWLLHVSATEPTFPELDPLVYAEMQITRSTKQVDVIRHDEVIADQPGGCFCAPDVRQGVLDGGVRHPRYCILGIDRYEENVRLAQENVRAERRRVAADIAVDAFALRHNPSVGRESGKEKVNEWSNEPVGTTSTSSQKFKFPKGKMGTTWKSCVSS